jgi:hypothetical protein
MPGAPLTALDAKLWLSTGRLGIYLSAVGNDMPRALRLYDWNARITAACLQDLGHLEVLVRNSYDRQLSNASSNWTSASDPIWLRESGIQKTRTIQAKSNTYSQGTLRAASSRASHPTHGHIVANLTFGFWTALTQSERDATIWTPILSPLFPGAARGPVHDRMDRLNKFRNRLAHWEPVFSRTTGLMRQLTNVDALFADLSPAAASWVGEHSSVISLIQAAPEPLLSPPPATYLGTSP